MTSWWLTLPFKLWLDDERPAPEGWLWLKTAQAAIDALQRFKNIAEDEPLRTRLAQFDSGLPDIWTISHMSFDHDLADVHYEWFHATQVLREDHPARIQAEKESAKEMTGYDVILWMAEHEVWPTETCYVHTHNSVRGPVMADMINRYGPYDHLIRWERY
jgi:hypothetical protein